MVRLEYIYNFYRYEINVRYEFSPGYGKIIEYEIKELNSRVNLKCVKENYITKYKLEERDWVIVDDINFMIQMIAKDTNLENTLACILYQDIKIDKDNTYEKAKNEENYFNSLNGFKKLVYRFRRDKGND